MNSHIRRLLAVALLGWATSGFAQAIDCSTPTGALALMMAGSIDPSTAQCGSAVSGVLGCAARSRLFLIDQGPNLACAQRVRMHLFFADLPMRFLASPCFPHNRTGSLPLMWGRARPTYLSSGQPAPTIFIAPAPRFRGATGQSAIWCSIAGERKSSSPTGQIPGCLARYFPLQYLLPPYRLRHPNIANTGAAPTARDQVRALGTPEAGRADGSDSSRTDDGAFACHAVARGRGGRRVFAGSRINLRRGQKP